MRTPESKRKDNTMGESSCALSNLLVELIASQSKKQFRPLSLKGWSDDADDNDRGKRHCPGVSDYGKL